MRDFHDSDKRNRKKVEGLMGMLGLRLITEPLRIDKVFTDICQADV